MRAVYTYRVPRGKPICKLVVQFEISSLLNNDFLLFIKFLMGFCGVLIHDSVTGMKKKSVYEVTRIRWDSNYFQGKIGSKFLK